MKQARTQSRHSNRLGVAGHEVKGDQLRRKAHSPRPDGKRQNAIQLERQARNARAVPA